MYAGFDPSALSVSITESAIARICRALVPEQMRKKSVKPAALRKSSTTTSVAFLSPAARTALSTCFGRRWDLRRFSVFAMQPACRGVVRSVGAPPPRRCRRVKSVLLNVLLHRRRHQAGDRLAVGNPPPDRSG